MRVCSGFVRPTESSRQPLPAYRGTPVADHLTDLIEELCVANRILSHEGVLDAFGHVSVRHPSDPNRYLLARSRSPLLIEPDDILEYKLDSEPVKRTSVRLYSGACHSRLHLSGAQRRDGGLPSPCAGGDAVLRLRQADRAGVPCRRHDRRTDAVLGSGRRIRRHQSPGGQAGGRPIAGADARPALGGADAPPRRHRRRHAA